MATRGHVFALLICMSSAGLAGELGETHRVKLHPEFQSIVAASFPELLQATSARELKPAGRAADGTPLYDAIIYTSEARALGTAGVHAVSVLPTFVTAEITPRQMVDLAKIEQVRYVRPGSILHPTLDVSTPEIGASLVHAGFINNTPYTGSGAIVLIYDSGVDWKHMDFRNPQDPTKSRILAIWDQTLTPISGEIPPSGMPYGVEYTRQQIENELDGTPAGFVREHDINGHGTQMAGIACGNGFASSQKYTGVAPDADILVVKGGDGSFSDTRIIDGLTYAQSKATAAGKPIVVNLSLGHEDGAHDGTDPLEVAIDNFSSASGRIVCVAAGNNGSSPVHVSGTIPGSGNVTISLSVPAYTPTPGTNNDIFLLDVWFDANPSVTATVTSPGNVKYVRNSGETGTSPTTTDGTIELNNVTSPANSSRNISLVVIDAGANVPKTGTWTLALANGSTAQTYDAWLAVNAVGNTLVSVAGGNVTKTISMPGTSNAAITIGAYETKWAWPSYTGDAFTYVEADRTGNICSFSSAGPTRDGRQKPEVAAPGQGIVSALSSSADTTGQSATIQQGQKHWLSQGTSHSTAHATGVAALLLGALPSLTSAQVKSLITSTTRGDAFTGSSLPTDTWGYGKIDALEAIARAVNPAATVQTRIYSYDGTGANLLNAVTGVQKFAVRFTPTLSGQLTGMQMNITNPAFAPVVGTGPLNCEIFSDASGLPGTKLGQTVHQPFSQLSVGTNNYIGMTGAEVAVNANTSYHLVLSVPSAHDTIELRSDSGPASGDRSSYFNGSSWTSLTDRNLRLRAIVTTTTPASSVGPLHAAPAFYALSQNYPNPFNPSTSVKFALPLAGNVSLVVFDVLGRLIASLVDGHYQAGYYSATWNASYVASGVYFIRFTALDESGAVRFSRVNKLVLLR